MIRVAILILIGVAALTSRAETLITVSKNGRIIAIPPDAAVRLKDLAIAVLVSSTYEAPAEIATEERWAAALRTSHVSVTFSEPHTFRVAPPRWARIVPAEQILIPASSERTPDYILVRFHDGIRAFAKFTCEADTALRRAIASTQTQ